MEYLIVGIASYLMGSIPFGLILTKIFLKKDIRDIGSGNIGATNVLRTGNKLIGYLTLVLDITKAIIPVNLYGHSANYDLINKVAKKYNLKVIEDCAQSAGALYKKKPSGSFGDLSAFSFYPTKNLGGYGDGGMILTNNKKLYEKCKKLRKYGMSKFYYSDFHGINSRLDEIQAAILNFQLSKLKSNILKRRKIAKLYNKNLKTKNLILPTENRNNFHSYYVYVVIHPERKKIMQHLRNNNIFCNISYPFPIHSMKGYKHLNKKNTNLKITDKLSKQIFSLPMYPDLSEAKIEKVINTLNKF